MAKKTDAGRKALEENRKRTQAAFAAAKQAEKDAAFRASEKARLDAEADAEVAAREAKRQRNTPQARAQRLAETKKAQEAKQGEARQLAAMVRAKRQKARGRKGRARPVTMQEAISQAAEIRQAAQDRAARTADAPSKTQVVDATYDAQGKIDTSGLADNTIVRTPEGTFKKYDTETGGLTDVAFDPISDKFGLPEQPKAGSFDTQDFTRTQLTELRKLGQSDPRFAEMFSDFQSRQIDIMRDPNLRPDERRVALDELSREIGDTYGMTSGYRRDLLAAQAEVERLEEQASAQARIDKQRDEMLVMRARHREQANDRAAQRLKADRDADSQTLQNMNAGYANYSTQFAAENEFNPNAQMMTFDQWRTTTLRQEFAMQEHRDQIRAIEDRTIDIENQRAILQDQLNTIPDLAITAAGKLGGFEAGQRFAQGEFDRIIAMDHQLKLELSALGQQRRDIRNAITDAPPPRATASRAGSLSGSPEQKRFYNVQDPSVQAVGYAFPLRGNSALGLEKGNEKILELRGQLEDVVLSGRVDDIPAIQSRLTTELGYKLSNAGPEFKGPLGALFAKVLREETDFVRGVPTPDQQQRAVSTIVDTLRRQSLYKKAEFQFQQQQQADADLEAYGSTNPITGEKQVSQVLKLAGRESPMKQRQREKEARESGLK